MEVVPGGHRQFIGDKFFLCVSNKSYYNYTMGVLLKELDVEWGRH